MPARKPSTRSKTKPAEEVADPAATEPAQRAEQPSGAEAADGIADRAAQIAADARALVTDAQTSIHDLNSRCVALLRADTGEHPASTSGVQRLPMAATDLLRALRVYGAVAAELAADAQR